jgi:16S rRNA (cytosine967-C5)-methyltransferase
MTPGARLSAAIEILELGETASGPGEAMLSGYFRRRRYAGAKDRRAVGDIVYGIWRRRARLDWWIARGGISVPSPRLRVLANAVLSGGTAAEVAALCAGSRHAPARPAATETAMLAALEGQTPDHPDMPPAVAGEVPEWLSESLRRAFGDAFAAETAALNRPAALDLRVNTLKADCARALKLLAGDGIAAEATPFSPVGLRVGARTDLAGTTAFKGGFVEVQDEGSQLAALLCDARPGMIVIDYCAGAGGKTLALAASMRDEGRLVAHDADAARLERLAPRLRRAGPRIVEMTSSREALPAGADRVLVDAPCSGTGRWRREPDARWRLTPEALAGYRDAQRQILDGAAARAAPGGRLIYVTCSVLREENDDRIAAFLAAHPDFAPVSVAEVWRRVLGTEPPDGNADSLQLTPARHGTDGFFVAILENHG